jgi:hypothetical protein
MAPRNRTPDAAGLGRRVWNHVRSRAGGHVHVVTTARPGQVAVPAASQPVPGGQSETPAHQPGQDIVAALQLLAQQVSELQADNDRLREDYDRLSAEVAPIRALMRQVGGAIAEKASQLLAGAGD